MRRIIIGLIASMVVWGTTGCPEPRSPKKSFNQLNLAKNRFQNADYPQAEVHAKKALALDPQNFEAHNLLGILDMAQAWERNQLLELRACLTGVEAEALRSEFDEHMEMADKHFADAVALDKEYAEAMASRGVVAIHRKQYDQAIKLLKQALLHPSRVQDLSQVRANLGWAYFLKDNHIAALKELRQANQFQPNDCAFNYRIGRVYFARKEWEKSLQHFGEVYKVPECRIQEAYYYGMLAHTQMERVDEAKALSAKCVALGSKSCVADKCRAEVPE